MRHRPRETRRGRAYLLRVEMRSLLIVSIAVLVPSLALAQEATAPVELRPATVRFRSDAPRVRVHYLTDPPLDEDGQGGLRVRIAEPHRYALLCDAPCDRELPRTHFALAFSRDGGPLARTPDPFGVDGHTGVRIRWNDAGGLRTAGLWTLAVGIPAGLLLAILPITIDRASGGDDQEGVYAALGAGAVVAFASIAVGIPLFGAGDSATFSVVPLPDDQHLFSSEWE